MKPSKTLTLAFFAVSLVFGTAIADPIASPADFSARSAGPRGGGFTTKAKLALLYGFGQNVRSVGVASVTSPLTGVYCITPSAKLNFKKIYPQISIERSLSVGFAFWAYWVDTTNSPINCTESQLEVITEQLNGTSVVPSNQVGFDIVVQ